MYVYLKINLRSGLGVFGGLGVFAQSGLVGPIPGPVPGPVPGSVSVPGLVCFLACPSSHWDSRQRAIWTGLLKVTTFQSDVSRPGGQFPSNLRTFNLINSL